MINSTVKAQEDTIREAPGSSHNQTWHRQNYEQPVDQGQQEAHREHGRAYRSHVEQPEGERIATRTGREKLSGRVETTKDSGREIQTTERRSEEPKDTDSRMYLL